MTPKAINQLIGHVHRAAVRPEAARPTDSELLERYLRQPDEAAFETLVRRHGPMVLGVCRRVLRNEDDAEDAFQATFLVLVRKAASIRFRNQLSNWLYGVAHNTALKARAMNHKRRVKEREAGAVPKPEAVEEVWSQVQALLDAELSRLPDKYRVPIVLCELEGQTVTETRKKELRSCWPVDLWLRDEEGRFSRRPGRGPVHQAPQGTAVAVSERETA